MNKNIAKIIKPLHLSTTTTTTAAAAATTLIAIITHTTVTTRTHPMRAGQESLLGRSNIPAGPAHGL